jgi:hypothetical protein
MQLTPDEMYRLVNGDTVTIEVTDSVMQAPLESVVATAKALKGFVKQHGLFVKTAPDPGPGYWERHRDFLTHYSPMRGVLVRVYQDVVLRLRHVATRECPSGPCGVGWQLVLIKMKLETKPQPPETFAKDED